MFIFKSIVGKLWITIIGLVVVVLLTVGAFLFKFIETSFPKSKDQVETLSRLATKVASEISLHKEERRYLQVVNELLNAQGASVLVVTKDYELQTTPVGQGDEKRIRYDDLFTKNELAKVFAGQSVDNRSPMVAARTPLGRAYAAVAVPFMSENQAEVAGALIMYQLTQSSEVTQDYVKKLFVVVGVAGFLMTTFFAFFLLTRITQPLLNLKKAADLISEGEYGSRVPIQSSDEIGELGKTFNHMGEQLQDTIRALSHEKEHLSNVLRSMADAVVTFDPEGNVILDNPEGERIIRAWNELEWLEDDPNGTPAGRDQSEREWRRIPEPLKPLFEEVTRHPKEMTTKLHVTSEVWSVVMAPLYVQDTVRGVVAVLRNVTEEYRLEKLRKDFVANVSHELRTPLSMLHGYSEALLDDIAATPEDRQELAQVIYDESKRMGRLVHDLLDLARMENGHMELNLRELDVHSFIKRMHRKFAALSKEKGIAMTYSLPEEKLELERADEDRLEQVLTNLLDNAIRHTPAEAEISITASSTRLRGEEAVLIEVADQGYGIGAEDLPYIFERFYKADKARTRGASGGTGLGLSIVRNIVEAHQGTVQAKSQPGQGTTFSIILPRYSGKT
ncbi:two-component system, OmpR family, sensor histidine kinase ResE [Paenibacillus sp. UNCCL117]|uniref:ATP-binding protein n=1 Tax=unclassified Paenibacillus TaxID=185978 RepID=UPI00088008DA|nr:MULTISPECIES: ATP-binding protein [unclassified Paenibacillus]SDC39194.1 two-component system, OmpR family, sensor histidine kinase ResE [Paenibacillus sp. cl123]SFW14175.1 two-component system, OmpR family, sensor histidine kinase ResE [Paenibacillus sp. UNCCL117]